MSKDSVTEAISLPSSIKSWLKFNSPTEQRLFVTKQRERKKFYCLLPLITRPHRILKKILMKHWYIIQQQPRLAHIFNQPPIMSYRKNKITQGRFSSRKTSLNHTAIINSCKQRSTFKKFVSKTVKARRKFTYDLRLATRSACVRAYLTATQLAKQN